MSPADRATETRTAGGRFLVLAPLLGLVLAGCGGVMDSGRDRPVVQAEAAPPAIVPAGGGPTIGSGSVKVALILPLGGGPGIAAAQSMRNAAELAMTELGDPDVTVLVKDDRGTAEGAREAANAAVADGAELVLGPLFAPSVGAAGAVARGAERPLVAFSTDVSVASRGVYLLSFLPQTEVDRVVDYAASQGRRSVAALIPDTIYGSVVEAAFRETAARRGVRVVALERYGAGQPGPAVTRIAGVVGGTAPQADALLIPAPGEDLAAIGTALTAAGFSSARVKPLGTGLWNDPRAARVPALQGGWFAAPDPAGYGSFTERYRARFGTEPVRIATLAYDAVSLAAALARAPAPGRFSEAVLQAPTGFAGADGVFRFRPDGTNERALAVSELRGEGAFVVSPAPRAFGGGSGL